MAQILTYNQLDRSEWSQLVRASRTGTWFQSPDAYDFYAFMPHLTEVFALGVSSDTNDLYGVCVGYITQERSAFRQFFTRRAIIIGGVCLADNATCKDCLMLMQAVRELVRTRAIFIETRNFNDYSCWAEAFIAAGFDYKRHLNFHVDCSDINMLYEHMSDNRKRQYRKAVSFGMYVEPAQSEKEVREWYEILSRLYRTKVKTPLFPLEFFLNAYRRGVGVFLLAKYNQKIIGGSMLTVMDGRCVYEWYECGQNADYKDLYPSVNVTFAGMQYATMHGCSRYDMMGAGEPDVPYGVRDFKAEFGGKLVEHGRFLYICNPLLYKFGSWGIKIIKRK